MRSLAMYLGSVVIWKSINNYGLQDSL